MFAQLADWLLRFRWIILLAVGVTTAVAAAFAMRIDFDFTPQAVFAGNDDLLAYSEQFKRTFGYEDATLIVVVQATGDRDVLDGAALTWQAEVSRQLSGLPHVRRVESVATVEVAHRRFWRRPWITTKPLINELPVDEASEARIRAGLSRIGLLDDALLSRNRRIAAIVVLIDPEVRSIDGTREVVEAVESVFENHPPPPGFALHQTGLPAIRVDIVNRLRANQDFFIPISGAFFAVVLTLLFRRISGTLLPLLAVGVGITFLLAVLVVAGWPLNIITNILPTLLLIIGLSNCVHVVSRYGEECERLGGDRHLAAKRTLTHMAVACLLTYLTTAIGFSSLLAARSDALNAFGWQAALGMGFLYLSTILVLATLLPSFRPPAHGKISSASMFSLTRSVAALGSAVARRPVWTLSASGLLVAASLWAARDVSINSYMLEVYDRNDETMRSMKLVEEELGGFLPLEVSLTADEPGRFLEPDVYRKVAAAQSFAAEQEGVISGRSYVDIFQEVYAHARGRMDLREELPAADDSGERRIARMEMMVHRVNDAVGYRAFMTRDGTRARILLRVGDLGSRQTLALIDRLETRFAELFPPEVGIEVALTGDAYVSAKAMDGFVRDLFFSLLAASMVIFAAIAVLFRSLRVGLIASLPNLTPLVITLGYMGLRGYEMNAANVIVFAISLGIAVDDTIHFLSRFYEEWQHDNDVHAAIVRSFQGTGRAIVLTSMLIIGGLAILLTSDFIPTRRFAELTGVTMIAALVGDLLLLPACIVLFWPRAKRI